MAPSSALRVARLATAGMLGGLVTFLVMNPGSVEQETHRLQPGSIPEAMVGLLAGALQLGSVLGASVGGILCGAEDETGVNAARVASRLAAGAAIGAVCGAAGGVVGQVLFSLLLAGNSASGAFSIIGVVFARAAAWTLMGMAAGLCPGIVTTSMRRALQGMLGGAVGGAAGGLVFDLVGQAVGSGTPSRFIGFCSIGALIGALLGIVEEVGKVHWLTIASGAREGRSHILSKPVSTLGRDERADIALFGDPQVERAHARFLMTPQAVRLEALAPMAVNGAPVASAVLTDGDTLSLGRQRLVYRTRRASSAPAMAPAAPPLPTAPAPPAYAPMYAGPLYAPAPSAGLLEAIAGPHAGARFAISDCAVIGRDTGCAIALTQDVQVSRNHARIAQTPSGWRIDDCGSTNGLFVNGQRVTSRQLAPGDHVGVGQSVLRVL